FVATKIFRLLENDDELIVPAKEIKNEKGKYVDNKLFTKEDGARRTKAKETTFGLGYGKSTYNFAKDWGVEYKVAEAVVNGYLDAFPGLKTHFKKCEMNAQTKDYIDIEPKMGVRWHCTYFKDIEQKTKMAQS